MGAWTSTALEPARRADAPLLAAMSAAHVEAGLKPAWGAARIGWHVRDADSVVLTARASRAHCRLCDHALRGRERAPQPARRSPRRTAATASRGGCSPGWRRRALTAGTFIVGLELRASNAGARAFYAALGYQESGEVPGYYQGVESAIRLTRDVRASRATPGTRQPSP